MFLSHCTSKATGGSEPSCSKGIVDRDAMTNHTLEVNLAPGLRLLGRYRGDIYGDVGVE